MYITYPIIIYITYIIILNFILDFKIFKILYLEILYLKYYFPLSPF